MCHQTLALTSRTRSSPLRYARFLITAYTIATCYRSRTGTCVTEVVVVAYTVFEREWCGCSDNSGSVSSDAASSVARGRCAVCMILAERATVQNGGAAAASVQREHSAAARYQ